MASKDFEKSRKRKHQKTDGKAKKMKKSPHEIVRRTRGRDTGARVWLRKFDDGTGETANVLMEKEVV